MNYRRFISSTNVNLKVNDHLIECGQTTWQIRNIAATSVRSRTIPFKEPEPKFEIAEPVVNFNFFSMAVTALVAWIVVHFFFSSPNWAIFAVICIASVFIYFSIRNLKQQKLAWLEEKTRIEGNWEIWNEMRSNPPVLYSLMLETNAGSNPLFRSFEEPQIIRANDAIKRAMEKKTMGDTFIEIETANFGGEESINNFGSSVYTQSIQEK